FVGRRQRWADRTPMTIVLVTGDEALHRAFCDEVLRMTPDDLEAEQLEKQYRGQWTTKVVKVRTSKEALETIAKTPGAIGYVRGPGDATVKVLRGLALKGI